MPTELYIMETVHTPLVMLNFMLKKEFEPIFVKGTRFGIGLRDITGSQLQDFTMTIACLKCQLGQSG